MQHGGRRGNLGRFEVLTTDIHRTQTHTQTLQSVEFGGLTNGWKSLFAHRNTHRVNRVCNDVNLLKMDVRYKMCVNERVNVKRLNVNAKKMI